MTNLETFKAGKSYKMTFVGDSDLIVEVKIIKRTAKTVTIKAQGEEKRCGIKVYGNSEYINPDGKYSMCPSCYARKPF